MSERQRLEKIEFMREFEQQERELAARLEAPLRLKKAKEALGRNTKRLLHAKRFNLIASEIQPYIPAHMIGKTFASQEEISEFNRAEAKTFYESTPEWRKIANSGNIETLQAFFIHRGITAVSKEMYASAFRLLEKAGLMEEESEISNEAPAPVVASTAPEPEEESLESLPRLPLDHTVPASWEDRQDAQWGVNFLTGEKTFYTARQIRLMDSETYRKVFQVPTPALTKANFGQR